ncbi:MAG: divergent polysaccharide deacetylase family protein [Pseudomonadota bacterium]
MQKRQTVALPRRRTHLALAGALLVLALGTPWLLSRLYGSEIDAEARGSVSIAAMPEGKGGLRLDRPEDTLPDLLAGMVEPGDNPTATAPNTDALGNTPKRNGTEDRKVDPKTPQPRVEPKVPPLDNSLLRDTPQGRVPGPNAAGVTPLNAYRAELPTIAGRRPVSVIIGGLGINPELTDKAIRELPSAVTLSFAAQSTDLQSWIDRARAFGHEVLLEIPMEGEEPAPLGDQTLSADNGPDVNLRALRTALAKAQGYVGVTHYQGERFLQRTDATGPVLTEIGASGLAFFTDGSFDTPSLGALSASLSLPYAKGDGLIDPAADPVVIAQRLGVLSETARSRDGVIGVGFAYPQTIDAVKGWAATLSADGLVLVPATAALP